MGEIFRLFGTIGIRGSDAEKELDGVARKGEQTSNKLSSFFKKAATVIAGVFAAGKLIDFGKMSIEAAASAKATQAQFEQVFDGIVGTAEQTLNSLAKEVGAVPTRIKPAFNQIASFAKVAGMDTTQAMEFTSRATRAAADTAAFYDKSLEETTETLKSYLKGNFQVADNLGILSTETTRNAKATELFGKEYSKLSGLQQQEVLLRMYEDANKVSGAMGQASREADGWENVMGNLKQTWEDFKATIGSVVLDSLVIGMQNLTGFVNNLKDGFLELKANGEQFIKGVVESESFAKVQEIFSKVVENLKAAFDNIGGVIKDVSEIVGSFVDDLIKIATAEDTINTVGGAFETLSGFVRDATGWIKDLTGYISSNQTAMDLLKSTVVGIVAAYTGYKIVVGVVRGIEVARKTVLAITNGLMLAQFVRTKALTAAEAANAAATMGASGAFKIFNAVLNANKLAVIITAITAVTAALTWFFTQTETGKKIWQDFTNFLTGLWNGISSWASETWQSVVDSITSVVNSLTEFFSNVWTSITNITKQAWNAFLGIITPIIQPIVDMFKANFELIQNFISTVWNAISTAAGAAWELIKNVIIGPVLVLLQLLTGNFEGALSTLSQIWTNILTAAQTIWESLCTIVSAFVDTLVQYVVNIFTGLSETFGTIMQGIMDVAVSIWSAIVDSISGFVSSAYQFVADGVSNMFNIASQMFSNIVQAVGDFFGQIPGTISGIWNDVTSYLSGINLYDIGMNIIQGLIDGIAGMASSVVSTIQNVVGGAIDFAKNLLGIHSPSRVFKEIGKFTGEGLAIGINSEADNVAKASENMIDSVIPESIPQIPVDYSVSYGTSLSNMQDAASKNATVQPIGHDSKIDVVIELLLKILEKDNNTYLDGRKLTDVVNGYNKLSDRRMMRARGELT
jgi:phage-related protein